MRVKGAGRGRTWSVWSKELCRSGTRPSEASVPLRSGTHAAWDPDLPRTQADAGRPLNAILVGWVERDLRSARSSHP